MLKLKLSNTLATWCEELTHWKRSWCWERLRAGGEGDDRGWDGWMASLTQRTWVWASTRTVPGEGQGSLVCCSPWGCKEFDTIERLNYNKVCHSFSFKEQVSFNFVTAVTVCSGFVTEEGKICHCFHFLPIYLPWNDGTGSHDFNLLSFKPAFSLSSFTFIRTLSDSLVPLHFLPLGGIIYISGVVDISPGNLDSSLFHPAQNFAWCIICRN